MAFTTSVLMQGTAFGNQLVRVMNVTADGAESNLDSGLQAITFATVTSVSAPTGPSAKINQNSSGTASNGTIGLSGCTSGNIYLVVAYGR